MKTLLHQQFCKISGNLVYKRRHFLFNNYSYNISPALMLNIKDPKYMDWFWSYDPRMNAFFISGTLFDYYEPGHKLRINNYWYLNEIWVEHEN